MKVYVVRYYHDQDTISSIHRTAKEAHDKIQDYIDYCGFDFEEVSPSNIDNGLQDSEVVLALVDEDDEYELTISEVTI